MNGIGHTRILHIILSSAIYKEIKDRAGEGFTTRKQSEIERYNCSIIIVIYIEGGKQFYLVFREQKGVRT